MQKHRFYFISPPSMAVLKGLSRENRTCSTFIRAETCYKKSIG